MELQSAQEDEIRVDELGQLLDYMQPDTRKFAESLIKYFGERGQLSHKQFYYAGKLIREAARMKGIKQRRQKKSRKTEPHYVYVVGCDRYCKIGYSVNPEKRRKSLQTGYPSTLRILCKIECKDKAEAQRLEEKLHKQFQDEFGLRGEWFTLDVLEPIQDLERRTRK